MAAGAGLGLVLETLTRRRASLPDLGVALRLIGGPLLPEAGPSGDQGSRLLLLGTDPRRVRSATQIAGVALALPLGFARMALVTDRSIRGTALVAFLARFVLLGVALPMILRGGRRGVLVAVTLVVRGPGPGGRGRSRPWIALSAGVAFVLVALRTALLVDRGAAWIALVVLGASPGDSGRARWAAGGRGGQECATFEPFQDGRAADRGRPGAPGG